MKIDYWGSNGILRGFGPVRRNRPIRIEFGDPLPVAGRGKAVHDLCMDSIESRLRAWGAPVR
ncbi:MAG: hypothetical protein IMZ55_04525 [Acidobacteria bacterium]|nr:hypothetical protein [Acidobacteriota bacterium]